MKDIKPLDIERWLFTHEHEGAARKAYNLLRPMLRMALKYDFIDVDPTLKVNELPKRPHYRAPTLTKQEVSDLIKGLRGSVLEPWVLVAATTGIRKEEGAALLWSDIDLETGAVNIDKGAQWVEGRECINPPKTKLSYRTVYIPEHALARLREIHDELKPDPDARITGTIHSGALGRKFKSECEKRGLPYIQPRCLRHSWATIALQEGVPISTVSRNLGHYDVSTTARYYIIPRDEEVIKASEVFGAAIANPAETPSKTTVDLNAASNEQLLGLLDQLKGMLAANNQ